MIEKLDETHEPDHEMREWLAAQPSPAVAWEQCDRPEWMLQMLSNTDYSDTKTLVLFACWCCRETLLVNNTVEAAEKWALYGIEPEEFDLENPIGAIVADAIAAGDEAAASAAIDTARWVANEAVLKAYTSAKSLNTLKTTNQIFANQIRAMISNPF